jgi:hypothetical protein
VEKFPLPYYFLRHLKKYPAFAKKIKKTVDFSRGRWYNTNLHGRTVPNLTMKIGGGVWFAEY